MEIQWSLVSFTALAGAGAWLFFCVGVDAFVQRTNKAAFPASLLAVVLLALGGLCSVTHLLASRPHAGRPGPLRRPGIFLEALLLGLLAVVAIVFAVLVKRQAGAGGAQGACPGGHGPGPCVHVLVRVFVPHGLAGGVEHAHLAARLPGHGRSIGHGRVGGADRRAERRTWSGGAPVRLGSAGRRCCGVLVLSAAYGFVSGMAVGEQALLFLGPRWRCAAAPCLWCVAGLWPSILTRASRMRWWPWWGPSLDRWRCALSCGWWAARSCRCSECPLSIPRRGLCRDGAPKPRRRVPGRPARRCRPTLQRQRLVGRSRTAGMARGRWRKTKVKEHGSTTQDRRFGIVHGARGVLPLLGARVSARADRRTDRGHGGEGFPRRGRADGTWVRTDGPVRGAAWPSDAPAVGGGLCASVFGSRQLRQADGATLRVGVHERGAPAHAGRPRRRACGLPGRRPGPACRQRHARGPRSASSCSSWPRWSIARQWRFRRATCLALQRWR